MSDKSVRAQIYENSLMFIKRQINAENFVQNMDELFVNENFDGIDETLFNDINDLATLASLYVKDPEIRKEEVSYIDKDQLLQAVREFLDRNENKLK